MSRGTLDSCLSACAFVYGAFTLFAGFSKTVPLALTVRSQVRNPGVHAHRFGLFPFRSPLLWKSILSFSSSGYLDVSVPRVPFRTLWIHVRIAEVCSAGFPHSDISGSQDMCSSPKLFAAYHVFHRLSVPRHPPYALFCLTSLHSSFPLCAPRIAFRSPSGLGSFLNWIILDDSRHPLGCLSFVLRNDLEPSNSLINE